MIWSRKYESMVESGCFIVLADLPFFLLRPNAVPLRKSGAVLWTIAGPWPAPLLNPTSVEPRFHSMVVW